MHACPAALEIHEMFILSKSCKCSVVIGAGAAGIMLAAKIPRYFKEGQVELQVYEKNHEG